MASDHDSFSSAVSRFLQVPNGLDGAEHAAFREVTDPFFAPAPVGGWAHAPVVLVPHR